MRCTAARTRPYSDYTQHTTRGDYQMTELLDCGHEPSAHDASITTGYARTSDGQRICYACAADRERADMIATGRATLYLVDSQASIGRAWTVQNWPSSLCFPVTHTRKSARGGGFGADRIDAWFAGPDGYVWHAVNRGDNQVARCRRMKEKTRSNAT